MPTLTTCTACGCCCDDIRLSVDAKGNVTQSQNACDLGRQWFELPVVDGPVATMDGEEAPLDAAIARAAELLAAAKAPLVAGFEHATTEAVRAAVALADDLGGCVDWTHDQAEAAATLALQTAGGVTATLGEVGQRADTILVWGADLVTTHPRYCERYLLDPTSLWISGREDRHIVAVDHQHSATCDLADESLCVAQGAHYESLSALRAAVAGMELDDEVVHRQTAVTRAMWEVLAARMKQAKYGAVVYGGQLAGSRESLVALTQLMAELTAHTRWVAVAAGSAGNKVGAANVLAWQTGYPLGVNFAQGYPQYGPHEWTAPALLAAGTVDAAVVVADDLLARLDPAAADHLRGIPSIALDWRDTATMRAASVAIRTARPGVECSGTTYRADGIALPLRGTRSTSRPTAEQVLGALQKHCEPHARVVEA